MALFVGVKSGEISNKRRSLKAAESSESRGHPWGDMQGKKLLDFARGFLRFLARRVRRDIQIVKEQGDSRR